MTAKAAFKYIFAFLFFLSIGLKAQESYQRLYSTEDRNLFNLGVQPASDGGFFLLNVSFERGNPSPDLNVMMVTRHDPKGTLLWSNEYTVRDVSFITNLKSIDFTSLENDTLLIIGSSIDFTTGGQEDEKFIFKIDPDFGDVVFADQVSNFSDEQLPVTFPNAVNGYDGDFNYFASHSNADSFGIQRVVYNDNDSILSKTAYFKSNEDMTPGFSALLDVQNTVDSNYVLSFVSDLQSSTAALATLTHDGSIINSNEYTISTDSIAAFIMQTVAIEATPDTGIVQVGIVVDLNTGLLTNHVIKTDSTGAIEWSKMIDGNALGFILQVNDVIYTSADEIMVTGKYINITTFGVGDFSIMFDNEGQLLRQWDYSSDNSFFIQINPDQTIIQFSNGELDNMGDGGMVYSTVGLDVQDASLSPYVIKTDPLGQAFCEDTLAVDLVRDFEYIRSGISMASSDFAVVDTFEVRKNIYNDFTNPVLMLLDTVFCPQDPIMLTLDATLESASSYEWSTGETTPAIDVFEEGEYSVTVTFEERVCYTLCDTSNITKRDFPEATIDALFFGQCELDSVQLSVGSNNPIVDILWSTGDSVNRSIFVTDPGLYSVSIIDDCDNDALAQINISDGIFTGTPEILDIFASGRTCDGVRLTPTVIGQTNGLTYAWSTGSMDQNILVTENGNYELTVTNECGNSDSFSITIQSLDVLTVEILDEGACDSLELFADVPLGSFISPLSYEWNDGTTTADLDNISGAGVYLVTVTDGCGTTATDQYVISDTIVFPDVFYPNNSVNPENRSFGPFIRCPEFFEGDNYRLEVYNRFGNRVFESNNVGTRWSGAYNNAIAPRDVYMFQWSYDLPDGETISGEGHVTLYR